MLPACIVARHDAFLVALAAGVCVATVLVAAWLLPRSRTGWKDRLLACLVLGLGAWTTHFVAILGFEPSLQMTYDPGRTIASAVVALAGVGLGTELMRSARRAGALAGGMLAGASIVAMHYTGMVAIAVPGTLAFSPLPVSLSLVAAVTFGGAAFDVLRLPPTRRRRLTGAVLLLACIVGLHFLGMAAVSIEGGGLEEANGLARNGLALATGLTGLLLTTCIGLTITLRAAARRRQQERDVGRLREFAELSIEALAICDADGIVLDANSQLLTLTGLDRKGIVGQPVEALFRPGEAVGAEGVAVLRCLRNDVPVEAFTRQTGTGMNQRVVLSLRDVRERLQSEQRIHHMAHHDALTGLPNRTVMSERLLQEIARCRRNDGVFAVLYIDLDRFKPINDVYGHAAGDAVLRQVADRLQLELRGDDLAARLGGDEFAVIQSGLSRAKPNHTIDLAQRLLERLSVPYELDGLEVTISCSIGLSVFPDDAIDAEALLRGADIALYRAKESGRSTFAFFRPEMENAVRERHALEQDLRSAIGKGELSLAWQPQATSDGTVVIGFEALLRWRHPVRGNVPPDVFIPMAEGTGAILQIGTWALRSACEEAAQWTNGLRVAVNVSPMQIQQPDFAHLVAGVLAETGLDPRRLELEITESLFLSEPDRVQGVLGALKQLGVRVSLDDFGTGYSSLATLRRFPFDKIKLDRSFVGTMMEDAQSAAIVQAVLGLSRGLGLPVVAEGVETASQLGALRAAQCEEIQGYLIGRPQSIDMFRHLVHGPKVQTFGDSDAMRGGVAHPALPHGEGGGARPLVERHAILPTSTFTADQVARRIPG